MPRDLCVGLGCKPLALTRSRLSKKFYPGGLWGIPIPGMVSCEVLGPCRVVQTAVAIVAERSSADGKGRQGTASGAGRAGQGGSCSGQGGSRAPGPQMCPRCNLASGAGELGTSPWV